MLKILYIYNDGSCGIDFFEPPYAIYTDDSIVDNVNSVYITKATKYDMVTKDIAKTLSDKRLEYVNILESFNYKNMRVWMHRMAVECSSNIEYAKFIEAFIESYLNNNNRMDAMKPLLDDVLRKSITIAERRRENYESCADEITRIIAELQLIIDRLENLVNIKTDKADEM